MLFHCPRVEANFPPEKVVLVNHEQARLLWDEHGGTFVLRVEGLEVVEAQEPEGEAMIRVEVTLPEPADLAQRIESFAGRHSLHLVECLAGEEFSETPILVACHIPGKNLFIYSEGPQLTLRRCDPQTMEFRVSGAFKSRGVPFKETDLVIHLDLAGMCRVLAGMLAWARKGA